MVVHQLNKVRTYISGVPGSYGYMYENRLQHWAVNAIAKRELAKHAKKFNYVEDASRVTGNTTYWNDKKRYLRFRHASSKSWP
jgi:hypothetical protein